MMSCSETPYYLFTGTYTREGGEGIKVLKFQKGIPLAGSYSLIRTENPSYLAFSSNGKIVYAVNENGGAQGGAVSAFTFDKESGELRFINSQKTSGDHPCYISVDANNEWILTANYSGGSVSVFPLNKDGSIGAMRQLVEHQGSSKHPERQSAPHAHMVAFHPDGNEVWVTDLGTDETIVYGWNPDMENPLQEPVRVIKSEPGSGPRHFVFHPSKNLVYIIEEMSASVSVYDRGGQPIQRITIQSDTVSSDLGSADIHISGDGKFLYVSNRGDANNIVVCSIHPDSGKLEIIQTVSSGGRGPRNFSLTPDESYLVVANQITGNIVSFSRNGKTGALTMNAEWKETSPVCIKFLAP